MDKMYLEDGDKCPMPLCDGTVYLETSRGCFDEEPQTFPVCAKCKQIFYY